MILIQCFSGGSFKTSALGEADVHFREAVQGGGRQAAVRGCWDALRCGFVKAGPPVRPLEEKVCPQVGSDTRPSPGAGSQRSCPDIWLLSSASWHSPPGPGSVRPGAATLAASCHHSSLRSSDRSRHRAISLDQASVILFSPPSLTSPWVRSTVGGGAGGTAFSDTRQIFLASSGAGRCL